MVYSVTQLSLVFSAVADPTRRSILETLRTGERAINDLAKPFEMTLPGVSKHIRVLERAGLVEVRRAGRVRLCSLRADALRVGQGWIVGFADFWQEEMDQLERYLSSGDSSGSGFSKRSRPSARGHVGPFEQARPSEHSSPSEHHRPSGRAGSSTPSTSNQ